MQLMVSHRRLGMVDSLVAKLDQAANEYDEKLHLNRHPDTGQWAVYIDLERPQKPYPVMVLNEPLPDPRDLIERLRRTDTHRRDIRAEMNRSNDQHMAEIEYKSRQEVGKAAEMVHAIAIKQGMASDNQSRRKIVKQ